MTFNKIGWNFYETESDPDSGSSSPATATVPVSSALAAAPYRNGGDTQRVSQLAAPVTEESNVDLRELRRIYARLYPYQRELFRVSALQDSLIHLQTGGGKTWVASALVALHLAMYPQPNIFFVVGTVALAAQQARVLGDLTQVPVACITGGAREFGSADAFIDSLRFRVGVIIASKFFEWLSAKPEMVTKKLVSLVVLDEVHHAQRGPYRNICKQLQFLRDGIVPSSDTPLHVLGHSERADRLRDIGLRRPTTSVLATKLQLAAEEEQRRRAIVSPAMLGEDGDGVGMRVASPVLDCLERRSEHNEAVPHLVGLSASPVSHFEDREKELVELLVVLRCRLVGVVDEVADLLARRPNPAFVALSYLPLYEERVLQSALKTATVHVYRRMEALVPVGSARSKLTALRTTSVVSPAFATCCSQFLTDVAMSDNLKKILAIPPHSALVRRVQELLAERTLAVDHVSNSETTSALPTLSPTVMREACADFIRNGVKFLKAASMALIALQEDSIERMIASFFKDYSHEELNSIGRSCGPITFIVLRPVVESVFLLMRRVDRRHKPHGSAESAFRKTVTAAATASAATAAAATVVAAAPPQTPPDARVASPEEVHDAATAGLPLPLRLRSTHIQILMRLFTELALVANVMASAAGDEAERHLRVLVFVGTRDAATGLMRVLMEHCPFAYKLLRPEVLLGQKGARSAVQSYMTRAEQTALLDRFRSGAVQLVFSTSVAEEGIDVPACHVVLRCDRQVELRNIVQGCGRLRRRNTLFISLSNLLNSHPRLGYVQHCIQQSESLLSGLAVRCRADAWRLERDELVMSNESATGFFPVSLPPNPNEVVRLTAQENTLVVQQRRILLDLQREYKSEVFCVHYRDIGEAAEPLQQVRVEVMMVLPAGATTAMHCRHGDDVVLGSATGGVVRAGQKAFVKFCKSAQERGCLTREGRVLCPTVSPKVSAQGAALAGMHILSTYARFATPCVVVLGQSMCLCNRKTWRAAVLQHLVPSATVMTAYNEDLWTSRVEPQTVLREELAAVGASLDHFFIGGHPRRKGDEEGGEEWEGKSAYMESASEVGSSITALRSDALLASKMSGDTVDSRNWCRMSSAAGAAPWAEACFLLPLHRGMVDLPAESMDEAAWTSPVGSVPLSASSKTSAESECAVTEAMVKVVSTDRTGRDLRRSALRVSVRCTGPHAAKKVSIEALKRIGVTVVYDVDVAALVKALKTRRQVGPLEGR